MENPKRILESVALVEIIFKFIHSVKYVWENYEYRMCIILKCVIIFAKLIEL